MTIMLDLPPAMEKEIEESIAQRDSQRLQRLLMDAIPITVARLINPSSHKLTEEEFRQVSAQLITEFSAPFGKNSPLLSDYAVSREGIYEEHP